MNAALFVSATKSIQLQNKEHEEADSLLGGMHGVGGHIEHGGECAGCACFAASW
jgi:hypothetical protein